MLVEEKMVLRCVAMAQWSLRSKQSFDETANPLDRAMAFRQESRGSHEDSYRIYSSL